MKHRVFEESNADVQRSHLGAERLGTCRLKSVLRRALVAFGLALVAGVFGTVGTVQAQDPFTYEVTVINITHGQFAQAGDICRTGQILGLFAFVTHQQDFRLFELGRPVSGEFATLAESGLPFLLVDSLAADPKVRQVFSIPAAKDFPQQLMDGIVCPGEKLKTTIKARPDQRFSMAAMVFPTNDAFVALNDVKLPVKDRPVTYFSPVYDAGSESNDELCINLPSIPGLPGCPGDSVDRNTDPTQPDPNTTGGPGLGEGYAHIHSGIHGVGDLLPNQFDWGNPAAQITIRRIQ